MNAQPKVFVGFYNRTGNAAELADVTAEGAASAGADVRMVRALDRPMGPAL